MEEKELWFNLMDFIHDEELNCANFSKVLELTDVDPKNEVMKKFTMLYLDSRSKLGAKIKELLDAMILKGKRSHD